LYLILFPLITALFMLVSQKDPGRKVIIQISAIATAIVSFLVLLFGYDKGTLIFSLDPDPVSQIMFFIELVLAAYILYLGIRHRKEQNVVISRRRRPRAGYSRRSAHVVSALRITDTGIYGQNNHRDIGLRASLRHGGAVRCLELYIRH
jgi:hypothetical protein